MSNLNKVFLMGRLTRDPELRYTPQGVPVSDLGLAVNREYSAGGERRKETLFIDVTVWRKQAEICCQYLRKGNPIFIEGRLSMDTWDGQDGQRRVRYRVVAENFQFLGGRRDAPEGEPGGFSENAGGRSYGGGESEGFGGPPETNYGENYREAGSPADSAPAETGNGGRSGEDLPAAPADRDIPF